MPVKRSLIRPSKRRELRDGSGCLTRILRAPSGRQRLTICQAGACQAGRQRRRSRARPGARSPGLRALRQAPVARGTRVQTRLPEKRGGAAMVMFLTLLLMSVLAVAVCAAAFGVATAGRGASPRRGPSARLAVEPPRFFAQPGRGRPDAPRVPIEVLLSHIERHVRLEQAAAEAFLEVPTRDSLHSRTSVAAPELGSPAMTTLQPDLAARPLRRGRRPRFLALGRPGSLTAGRAALPSRAPTRTRVYLVERGRDRAHAPDAASATARRRSWSRRSRPARRSAGRGSSRRTGSR